MIKNIIFDFDGVIADTFQYHLTRYQKMFPEAGLTAKEFARVHRGNFNERDNGVWDKIDIDQYDADLPAALAEANLVTNEFKDFLQNLNTKNYVVSSGPEAGINKTIKDAGLDKNFISIFGRETDHSKVIKLNMVVGDNNVDEYIFVTDTLGDVLEANKVGMRSIAVDFGFHDRETLQEGNPLAICSSWEEVQEVIDSL